MGYRLFFAFFLIFSSGQIYAQEKTERHYRVELIVVRHLDGYSDSTPQQRLRDLGDVLDLYAPPRKAEAEPQSVTQAANDAVNGELLAEAEPEEPLAKPVEEMSDTMRESWRRLRGSAGFRPELFRAWEQSGDQPFPVLRIHDDELLFEIVPDQLLGTLPVDEHGALVFSDATLQRQDGSDALSRKNDAGQPNEPPTPQLYYRIDGTANLNRSRFLHLDLDIELREPLYEPQDLALDDEMNGRVFAVASNAAEGVDASRMSPDAAGTKVGPAAEATAFRIHRIAQRRQVKTEQMEYFDGPVIGVLAWVTGFDVIAEADDLDAVDDTGDTELAE